MARWSSCVPESVPDRDDKASLWCKVPSAAMLSNELSKSGMGRIDEVIALLQSARTVGERDRAARVLKIVILRDVEPKCGRGHLKRGHDQYETPPLTPPVAKLRRAADCLLDLSWARE